MKRTTVLHVWWSGGAGGAERVIRDIIAYSNNSKFDHIVCFLSSGGIIADQIKQIGGKVVVLGMKSGADILRGIKFVGLLREKSPDIVHVHGRTYVINILLYMFGGSAGRIYFEHGGCLISNNNKKETLFYELWGKAFDIILVNSLYVREVVSAYLKSAKHKIKLFYIGIDIGKYSYGVVSEQIRTEIGIPSGAKVVGLVGRLVEAKGVDDFIRVAVEIQKKRNDVCFVIIGDGEKRRDLEKLAKSLGVNIRFLGERGDIPQLLKLFDVFLFTSKWEPFGIVLLEAMASRVPVVGFDVPGAIEIISKGGGVLVEERNIKKAAERVVDLLDNPKNRQKLVDEGYANVSKNFNIKNTMRELDLIYESLTQYKNGVR